MNGNYSHNGTASSSAASHSNHNDFLDDQYVEGNVDSFLDDDDDGWHSADMVSGFSPTSPVHVVPPSPISERTSTMGASGGQKPWTEPQQLRTGASVPAQDLLGGDLDWEAWETPRGPSPSSDKHHDANGQHNDLINAFRGVDLQSSQSHVRAGHYRHPSPPIIDLRDMEKKLDARQHSQQGGIGAHKANDAKGLGTADLDFFDAFESTPKEIMDSHRDAARERSTLRGEQLVSMADAQESPLNIVSPIKHGDADIESVSDYFGSRPERTSSPVDLPGVGDTQTNARASPSHRGSWSETAGAWAGTFRKTLGSIRGRLPSAKDFYVPEDDEEYLQSLPPQEAEAARARIAAEHAESKVMAETSPSNHHHPRKLVHLQDYSQGTPFGGHDARSPSSLSPPASRASTGFPGSGLGHHSAAPIPGAPAFDPNAGRNWNTGSWSLTSKEEIERARKPIPVKLRGRREETQDVVLEELAARLAAYLPRRLQLGKAWKLLYSSDQDGISLGTLYHKVDVGLNGAASRPGLSDAEGWLRGASESTRAAVTGVQKVGAGINIKEAGLVVAIRDTNDRLYGAFVNEQLRPQSSYYGSGECFLWKQTDNGKVKTYKWTGRNDYMILTDAHYLSFGGGEGKYGLWLDRRLEQGVSSPCPSFNNDILCDGSEKATAADAKEGKFECLVLEVWACGID